MKKASRGYYPEKRNICGPRVAQARRERNMSQMELLINLQLSGIKMSIPSLSQLENRKRRVRDFELVALARILGVTVNWLIGKE